MLPASHLSWQFRMQLGGCDVRLAKWRKASPPVALPSPMRQSLAVRSLPSLLRFLPTRLRPDSKNYSPTQLSACLLYVTSVIGFAKWGRGVAPKEALPWHKAKVNQRPDHGRDFPVLATRIVEASRQGPQFGQVSLCQLTSAAKMPLAMPLSIALRGFAQALRAPVLRLLERSTIAPPLLRGRKPSAPVHAEPSIALPAAR
jgi:hypothetical protein